MVEVGSRTKLRLKYGGFEAVFAFISSSLAIISVDVIFSLNIGVLYSMVAAGGAAALEVIKELAEERRDYYKEKRELLRREELINRANER